MKKLPLFTRDIVWYVIIFGGIALAAAICG